MIDEERKKTKEEWRDDWVGRRRVCGLED